MVPVLELVLVPVLQITGGFPAAPASKQGIGQSSKITSQWACTELVQSSSSQWAHSAAPYAKIGIR